jgi:hypothetical protein
MTAPQNDVKALIERVRQVATDLALYALGEEGRPSDEQFQAWSVEMHKAADALARLSLPPEWQPIESAPKDGTRILVAFRRIGIHAVSWEEAINGLEGWCVNDEKHGPYSLRGYLDEDILGWMPLPAPPQLPTGDAHG